MSETIIACNYHLQKVIKTCHGIIIVMCYDGCYDGIMICGIAVALWVALCGSIIIPLLNEKDN